MELRPCFDGFAGIPQETRVLFSQFHDLDGVAVTGMLNHPARRIQRSVPGRFAPNDVASTLDRVAKMIISCENDEAATPIEQLMMKSARYRSVVSLAATCLTGLQIPTDPVESKMFTDYIWQRLFAKGLSPTEVERIHNAEYVSIRPSWLSMHTMGAIKRYPKLDTRGYDIFIAQTPWPSLVSPSTSLIVRYQDAIPMFHPHQIKHPAMHQFHHSSALRSNTRSATFVCSSESTRQDLLTLYPALEHRSPIIPVSVSGDFYPEEAAPDVVGEVVRAHQQGGKPPTRSSDGEHSFRYLLMVSTVEPRKNHLALIEAWEQLRRDVDPGLNLVIVGSFGWNHGAIAQRMKKWQQRGGLYHLSGVPTSDLRLLYSNATATVCPSVVEGFDLSGVESMFCGAPVAASDIPVHREVFGDGALYFDPYDSHDLVETLKEQVYSPNALARREAMVIAGFTQSKLFQRTELADRWGELFQDVRAGKYRPVVAR
jgi:glycosyltransferase involved in cell wall biosynthesis